MQQHKLSDGGNGAQPGQRDLSCGNCHASATDVDSYDFNDSATAQINASEWLATGHGNPAGANLGGSNVGASCLFCHDNGVAHNASDNFFRLASISGGTWGLNGVCMACHANNSTGINGRNASKKVTAYHYGAEHSGTSGGRWCWDCHDPHGDTNIKMIGATVAKASADNGLPLTQVPATFTANNTGTDYAGGSFSTKICNTCHSNTNHYTSTSSDTHNSGTRCTQCHTHNAGYANGAFGAD